jgi:hypothetical protein
VVHGYERSNNSDQKNAPDIVIERKMEKLCIGVIFFEKIFLKICGIKTKAR